MLGTGEGMARTNLLRLPFLLFLLALLVLALFVQLGQKDVVAIRRDTPGLSLPIGNGKTPK